MKTNFNILMKDIPFFDHANYDMDWRWKLLEELYLRNYQRVENKVSGKIPKLIHQIWLGGNIPTTYVEWGKTWKKFNPEYEYKLWTEADINSLELPNREAFDMILNPGPKSDIMRYHILRKFGGIYVDTDFQCLRSFDELDYLDFYIGVGYPSEVELYPGLIACAPNHFIMNKICEEIDKVDSGVIRKKGVLAATSSKFFTPLFFELVKTYITGIVAFPPDYFYPFPNHKEYQLEDGTKYIKKCSLALHHWEVSWNKAKDPFDWIQGDRFVQMANFVYSPVNKAVDDYGKWQNTFDITALKEVNIVYTSIMYLPRLLRIISALPNKFVVLSHNGDNHVEDGVIGTYNNGVRVKADPYIIPKNVIKLYCTNVAVIHPKIDSLPLGLENSMWGTNKKEEMKMNMAVGYVRNELVFMCHAINTNKDERQKVFDLFKDKDWVTVGNYEGNRKGFNLYFKELCRHKFIFNPPGNGFDNHRMWEAWYLGCIPISKRSVFTSFYEDMPMVIVDEWEQVTPEFLNQEYLRIKAMDWNKHKLQFAYWKTKIKNTL